MERDENISCFINDADGLDPCLLYNIKKQRHYFANKSPSGQGYGFSSGHVWMRVGL